MGGTALCAPPQAYPTALIALIFAGGVHQNQPQGFFQLAPVNALNRPPTARAVFLTVPPESRV